MQVDPIIQNPANSQALNPYSYIGNNPLSGKDPTGYTAACPDGKSSSGGCNSEMSVANKIDGFKTASMPDSSSKSGAVGEGVKGPGGQNKQNVSPEQAGDSKATGVQNTMLAQNTAVEPEAVRPEDKDETTGQRVSVPQRMRWNVAQKDIAETVKEIQEIDPNYKPPEVAGPPGMNYNDVLQRDLNQKRAEQQGIKEGSFSISDWTGYPSGGPKPSGPVQLIEGTEYENARDAANKANNTIRRQENLKGEKVDVHEVQPVKFGGSPTDPANKVIVPRDLHRQQLTPWWNQLQKDTQSQ